MSVKMSWIFVSIAALSVVVALTLKNRRNKLESLLGVSLPVDQEFQLFLDKRPGFNWAHFSARYSGGIDDWHTFNNALGIATNRNPLATEKIPPSMKQWWIVPSADQQIHLSGYCDTNVCLRVLWFSNYVFLEYDGYIPVKKNMPRVR
jgi:hypothetical protein